MVLEEGMKKNAECEGVEYQTVQPFNCQGSESARFFESLSVRVEEALHAVDSVDIELYS